MSVRSPTAGTWSSSQWRPDNEFETDRTELATEQRQSVFPQARIASGGAFLTPQGTNVQTVYVDLSGEVEAKGLCLVKATEPQYDLATASTIRLSLPEVFRHTGGEVLIQDEQEGRARTSTSESVDVPSKEPELVPRRSEFDRFTFRPPPLDRGPRQSIKTTAPGY